jgi:hypothetical protein
MTLGKNDQRCWEHQRAKTFGTPVAIDQYVSRRRLKPIAASQSSSRGVRSPRLLPKRKERAWYPRHVRGKLEIVGVDAKEGMTSRTSDFRLFEIRGCRRMKSLSTQAKSPNKAPEPTTMAVTPRATSRDADLKRRNQDRNVARGAPATVVAHL